MELHLALRNIIATDGVDIINDTRLVNILSDFKAFDAIPASKYILRAIIADGYSRKLYSIGEWNTKAETLCTQFASSTGFQYDYVDTIFKSIAYGLGWVSQIKNVSINSSPQTLPSNHTKTKIINDINNIVEVDPISTNRYTITIDNIFVEIAGRKTLHISCEVRKTSEDYWKFLFVVFFDVNGRIKQKYKLGSIIYDTHYLIIDDKVSLKILPSELSKILLMVQ